MTLGEDDTFTYNKGVINENINVSNILKNTRSNPTITNSPVVVLSLIFIPNFNSKKPISYEAILRNKPFCETAHSEIKTAFESHIDESDLERFVYRPYYTDLSSNEFEFMHDLKAIGCFLDIVKMDLLIRYRESNHLHMDSNTIILNWNALYENTYNSSTDSFGASRCSIAYIACHLKMVYLMYEKCKAKRR